MKADIVVDNCYGDSAKGKVTYNLLESGDYTHCIRFNGGDNAGHTIIHKGQKFITHNIPAGVFYGIRSIIGPGCVVNVESLFKEIAELEASGIDCSMVKIADNAHIITSAHLEEDSSETRIGTTRKGIGPAYRDKYARVGIRAKDVLELEPYLIDFHEELFNSDIEPIILLEAGQGFYLDPNFGDYPYVTSSHCTVAGALLNGIPHTCIRTVWGVAKGYDTYVGTKQFQPKNDPTLNLLCEVGKEFGATTGRRRQCNYINVNALNKAIRVNAVDKLVINKMDILKEVGVWKAIIDDVVVSFESEDSFKMMLADKLAVPQIIYSYSSERI